MAEEARLESVCTPKGYREFESRSLRKKAGAIASAFLRRLYDTGALRSPEPPGLHCIDAAHLADVPAGA